MMQFKSYISELPQWSETAQVVRAISPGMVLRFALTVLGLLLAARIGG